MTQHSNIANIWIVIAAYNEGGVIATTLADLMHRYPNVVVVDDCSTDNTS